MSVKLKDYLSQEENSIMCKENCELIIDLGNYESDEIAVKEEEKIIWVKSLVSTIKFEKSQFSIILDYIININILEEIDISKDSIKLRFPKGSIIFECTMEADELKKKVQFVDRLLGGREIYKDTGHLFRRLFKVYQSLSNMDVVHLEVLLSNCIRWKENPTYPARLGKTWDPIMLNVKSVVFNTGFVNGLAFENITKSIEMGLISKEDLPPSILEKVMTGQLVEEK